MLQLAKQIHGSVPLQSMKHFCILIPVLDFSGPESTPMKYNEKIILKKIGTEDGEEQRKRTEKIIP